MEKYRSRKFMISIGVGLATIGLAYAGKLNSDVAMIFSSLIVSYNVMQGLQDRK